MSFILSDRIKETTVTQGTGTITLAGALGGFVPFSSIGEGNSTYYVIENGTIWEIGIGTYSSGTLSRDTVLSSSSGGSKISLSGVSYVFVALPASKSVTIGPDGNFNIDGDITTDNIVIEKYGIFNNVVSTGTILSSGNIVSEGDISSKGLLTLTRDSAGNFFHAYVDDANDRTIALYSDATSAPEWKLGLKSSPSSETSGPTYAYVYGEDGSIGLYANSLNYLSLNHGGGFNLVNKGDTIFSTASATGTTIEGQAAAFPTLILRAAPAQSDNIQEWQDSSQTVLTKITSDGTLIVKSANILNEIAANTASGVAISGWAKYYVDTQDHSATSVSGYFQTVVNGIADATSVSGALQPQITQNTIDIVAVSGLIGGASDPSGEYYLQEIRSNSASGISISGALQPQISQNVSDIAAVSGWAQSYVDSQDHSAAAVSGWARDYVDSQDHSAAAVSGWADSTISAGDIAVSGWAESYVDSQDHSALAVSGWARDYVDSQDHSALSVSGALQPQITQNTLDIVTVSGLLSEAYDDTAISGYFESRADANETQIASVSGWAESYVDSQDHSAVAVSGWAEHYVDSQDHSAVAVSGWAEHYVDSQDHSAAAVSGWADATFSTTSVSGITFEVSGVSNEYRVGTTFIDPDGTEQVVRSTSISNGYLRLEVANFSPSVSAAGQSRYWDQPVSQWTVSIDNPTDFTSNYISGVAPALSSIVGSVTSGVSLYTTTGPSTTPAGGVDWTQTFTVDGDSPIYSSTSDLSGGSASATVSFLDKNGDTSSETATISFSWQSASSSISFNSLTGNNFLESYSSVGYNLTITGLSNSSNASTTITTGQGTLSNSSDDGTMTFTTAIHKDNNSGRTITATTDFTRPATVTGTEYTTQRAVSDSSISASFTYPSFYIFTSSTSNPPSRADIIDTNDFDATVVTELGNQSKTVAQTITNSESIPQCWWFAVRSSASQPTSFETGSGPSLLVTVTPTVTTVDLEPDSAPAGYSAEEYKLYGITLNAGDTYVKIS